MLKCFGLILKLNRITAFIFIFWFICI